MKLTTVLITCLSALTTAHTLPERSATDGIGLTSTQNVERDGFDFTHAILDKIDKFPGRKEIVHVTLCMRHHHKFTFDESHKDNGTVVFGNVEPKCYEQLRTGWEKYHDDWSKIGIPVFNDKCDGGVINGMSAKAIEVLKSMLKIKS